MGLDMYFYAKQKAATGVESYNSFSPWRGGVDETNYPAELKELGDYIFSRNFKSHEVRDGFETFQIGYFRKFNALHSYIVENLAGGVDECQEISMSKADVVKLVSLLKAVNSDEDLAQELLPTQSGFFFGSIDYDSYYLEDVREAINMFELFLKHLDFSRFELVYNASW